MGNCLTSRALWTLIGASTVGVLGACAPSLPAPQVTSVSPSWVDNDSEQTLTITGENLYPQIQVTGDDALDINQTFRAWLVQDDGTRFEIGVTDLRGYEQLTGLVPEGLPTGIYDLRLEAPTGLVDVMLDALQITETAASRMSLTPEHLSYTISQRASVAIVVQDPDGELLDTSFPVQVSVTDGPGALLWGSTLLDQQAEETGVSGRVASGQGLLQFEATEPGMYTLRVEPDEEDSHVTAQEVTITFAPGDVADISLALDLEGSSVTAGEVVYGTLQLLDAFGNPTRYPQSLIFEVQERCSNDHSRFEIFLEVPANHSEVLVPLNFFVASGTDACREGMLDVTAVSGGLDLSTTSQVLSVRPGAASALEVVNTFGTEFVAGTEPVTLLLAAEDGYGNSLASYNEALSFDDSLGGVSASQCQAWSLGQTVCAVTLIRAAEAVVLSVESAGGLRGAAAPVRVLAGPPATATLSTGTATGVAGTAREATLKVTDAYSNPVVIASVGADAPQFSLSGEALECLLVREAPGEQIHGCIPTRAGEGLILTATVGDLTATAGPFQIINGPLATVNITGVADVVAGESLSITVSGFDAYGNPFAEVGGGSRELELYDESGEIAEVLISLDADGTATRSLPLTMAWDDNALHAYQSGTWLGTSASFDVFPAALSGFSVEPARSWVLLDDALDVTARAVDAYDNTVTDYSSAATLSSVSGLGETLSVPAASFWEGVAALSFVFDSRGVGDTLLLSDTAVSGTSSLVDVVWDACAAGPSAVLSVDGSTDEAVLCRTEAGATDTVVLSAGGSSAGTSALKVWHFYTDELGWTRSTTSTTSTAWSREGVWDAQLVLVDAMGCADIAATTVYVADDDGQAAGPITVSLRDSTLSADSTAAGQTGVDIAANDCAGAAASGTLLVRASLGEVSSSTTTTVDVSGSGLELTLDAFGQAQIGWDVGSQPFGGLTADLYVGRSDGAALGSASATVSGDAVAPVLLSMDPAGTTISTFKSLTLTFSEPIDEDTVGDDTISLIDPDGLSVSILDYSVDDREVTLTLSTQAAPSTGTYTLQLDQSISDADGNSLSGDYSGGSADLALRFGSVSDVAPTVTACATDVSTFRPDGDDGSGKEGDTVSLGFSADGTATWWRLRVLDADGAVVAERLESAGASSGSLVWDGRDQAGEVVANGDYTLQISARDAAWNEGSACTDGVLVDNLLP